MPYNKSTHVITVEGNIGSGKSTLLNLLENYYKNNPRICFLLEPVDEWNKIIDKNNITILEKYYQDQKKYAYIFQSMASLTRYSALKNALEKDYDIIITERCIYSDYNIFTKMLYHNKLIDDIEYKIYMQHFNEFTKNLPEMSIIYLKTDPSISMERVKIRNRKGENISIEYLTQCHNFHEYWLQNITKNILKIDGNINFIENEEALNNLIDNINKFINIPCYIHSDITYSLYFDGGSRGNPGICGYGYVIYNNDNLIISEGYDLISKTETNNYAEYMGIINGLEKALELNIKNINVYGDSMLVTKQISKEFACNSDKLRPLLNRADALLNLFDSWIVDYIPRKENTYADALANKGMDLVNNYNRNYLQ
tara:strand:- start:5570 stop:6676 length:1107 start_codon:yes stop_codon:yes gene_type:complete